MSIDDLLAKLNINLEPIENENGSFTIELENSNQYSKYLSKLDKAVDNGILDLDDEASQAHDEITNMQYVNDEFVITLLGDLDQDVYKMVIRKM